MVNRLYDPEAIEARTPPDRDRFADLLRTGAVVMVVLGHWLVAAVLYRNDRFTAGQALQYVPEARVLTWVFQVMPLFFFVGGYVNASSWRRWLDRGEAWPLWLRRRARRLLTPLVPVLVAWIVVPQVLRVLLVPPDIAALAAQTALIPLWFLVVYLLVIGLMPITHALHRRFGVWVVVVAAAGVGIIDVLDRAEVPVVGYANYLLVWGGIHQLGYFWGEDRLPRRPRTNLSIAAVAAAVALVLIAWFGYPGSMVAVQGAERNNTDPPSFALLAYAVAQIAVLLAARGPLERRLQRPRVWAPVILTGSVALTLFLWHMTALVAVGGVVHLSGLWPRMETIDATWWALRPVWLILCGLVLAVLVLLFRRFEDQPEPAPRRSQVLATAGLVAFATGMGMIADTGIFTPDRPANVPLLPLALVVAGLGALGALWPRSQLEDRANDDENGGSNGDGGDGDHRDDAGRDGRDA